MSDYTEHLISMAGGDGEPDALDLDAIQARADAATEGPWNQFDAQIRHTQIDGWTDPEGRRKAQEQTDNDIEFVMNARTDVPALLALVREQQARIGRATRLIADLTDVDYCSFDHHGGCQSHGYLSLEPGETCPQQDAKDWAIAALTVTEGA